MIDNRQKIIANYESQKISHLCDRRFGVGADGLILLESHDTMDFKMVYFNADGNQSSMCGNGGRCIVAFARFLGLIETQATFEAIDGAHSANIEGDKVSLQMQDVKGIETHKTHTFLDTGSPHHVELVSDLNRLDVKSRGASIRFGAPYNEAGTNVDFVTKNAADSFSVRTYERGVEDETYSCGTGVTAVALAMNYTGETDKNRIKLLTPGGALEVSFEKTEAGYQDIWLIGAATQVFKGAIVW
jgi:diaminopimelate epimerase